MAFDSTPRAAPVCPYCASTNLTQTHSGLRHPLHSAHGPFDFYECAACGSGITYPLPSEEALSALYQSYHNGLPEQNREALGDEGERWHAQCVKRMAELRGLSSSSRFSWIDAGAGAGELAKRMATAFPNSTGLAIDLHERPPQLPAAVEWQATNLNDPSFTKTLGRKADIVFATGVWEHVIHPDIFARNMAGLLNEGGLLYLVCPDYGSFMRKILGTRWPYFTPGEHLTMPSAKGSRTCLARALAANGLSAERITSRPMLLTYSLFYTAQRFGLPFADLIPRSLNMLMPVGALESAAILSPPKS